MIPLRDVNPNERPPTMVITLIALNALAFWWELSFPAARQEAMFLALGLVPARYIDPADPGFSHFPGGYLPFLTSMFLHGGFMHFLGNMWFLWLFGDNVEDRIGHAKFLLFYVLCGLAAGATHLALNPHSAVPTIGASGAIAGVMGAYAITFPRAQVLTLIPLGFFMRTMLLPAWVFLGFWFVIQFFYGALAAAATHGQATGVAFWAHVGGFVAGILLRPLFMRPDPRPREWY